MQTHRVVVSWQLCSYLKGKSGAILLSYNNTSFHPFAVWISDGWSYQQELDVSEEHALMFRTVSLCPCLPTRPWIHRGPALYLCSEGKHVIAPIYRYIKHISPKLCDSTQQQHRISTMDGSIVLAWKSPPLSQLLTHRPCVMATAYHSSSSSVLNLLLATEIMLTTITEKRREKKGNFPELLPLPCNGTQWQVFVLVLIVDVFFFPLPHIFGKACSINQWHRCEQCSLEPLGQQA